MTALFAGLPAYLKLAQLQLQIVYAYRAGAIAGLIVALLRIFLLNVVWTAVYADRDTVGGISLADLITFLTLAQLQLIVMQPTLVEYLQRRIQEGQIGVDLVRPVPFLGQLLAQQAGATLGVVPFVLAAVPIAVLLGRVAPPDSPVAAAAYLVSVIFAWLIAMLIGLLMGLIAFWTVQTHGVQVIYNFSAQFFGGALVPLAFLTPALRTVAEWLPFQALAVVPLSLYSGAVDDAAGIARALGLQLFWIATLSVMAGITWQYARRVVTVYRG